VARTNEVRKECPSCGLGVPLDAKICEFCGWDFEEEDEWILQIEKLEQELMLEKQKFEDTSVDKMIQATLRKPERERAPPPTTPPKRGKRRPSVARIAEKGRRRPVTDEAPVIPKGLTEADIEIIDAAEMPSKQRVKPPADKFDLPPPPEDFQRADRLREGPKISRPTGIEGRRPAPPSGKKVRRVVSRTPHGKKDAEAGFAKRPPGAREAPSTVKGDIPKKKQKVPEKQPKPVSGPETRTREEPPSERMRTRPAAPAGATRKVKRKVTRSVKAKPSSGRPAKPPAKDEEKKTMRVFICPLCKNEVSEESSSCDICGAEFA